MFDRNTPPKGYVVVLLPIKMVPNGTTVFKPTGEKPYMFVRRLRFYTYFAVSSPKSGITPRSVLPSPRAEGFLLELTPKNESFSTANEIKSDANVAAMLPEREAERLLRRTDVTVRAIHLQRIAERSTDCRTRNALMKIIQRGAGHECQETHICPDLLDFDHDDDDDD